MCSHQITDFPTKIRTPDFPFAYRKGQDCLWVIEANTGMQIELDFPFFSLREIDEEYGCLDYVEIHESDGNTERFIGRYCGSNKPQRIVSKLKKLKLHFHADKRERLGWYMGFQANIKQRGKSNDTVSRMSRYIILLKIPESCGKVMSVRREDRRRKIDKDLHLIYDGLV